MRILKWIPVRREETKTLQLGVFTDKEGFTPRYDEKSFDLENQINTFVALVSPKEKMTEVFYGFIRKPFLFRDFKNETTATYKIHFPKNKVYLFLIEGEIELNNQILKKEMLLSYSILKN